VELSLFEEVADAVRGLVPPELGPLRARARRYGIKVWFGERDGDAPREHYEAQVIASRFVAGAKVLGLEVGFHAEHPKVAENEAVITHLVGSERAWRKVVGKEAVVGPFLGRADVWRRISETWPDPDLDEPGLGIEVAARLADYMIGLEPVRRRPVTPAPDARTRSGRGRAGATRRRT
jgi:hypothetical protein